MRHVAGASGPPAGPYDVDVVILALDRTDETEAAILSALAQRGVRRHVFVVDQGSSAPALARLARLVDDREDVTLVSPGANLGVPGGRNAGAALGHGRIIVGLDNDAEFADAGILAGAVRAFDEAADVAAIGFRILEHEGWRDDLSSWGYPRALLGRAAETFETVTFVGAGHAIWRAAWEQAGGYDASLFFCWEEYEFCLRALAGGWRVEYHGDLVVHHRVSAERRVSWSAERWFYFVRNRIRIERRWGAGWAALAPRLAGYLVKGALHGQALATLRAIAAAARAGRTVGWELPAAARDYIARNDLAWRGGLAGRLRHDVLARLPRAGTVGQAYRP